MSVFKDLQAKFKTSSILNQIIYINLGVFFLTFFINTFGFLMNVQGNFIYDWFSLPANLDTFITRPWSIITYGFLHADFLHILFNLIVLYFFGRYFLIFFSPKTFLTFYISGTILGGLIFFLSYNYFPVFTNDFSTLVGASSAISAIIVGLATYAPNYQIKFPLIGFIKFWHIAAVIVALDVIQIPMGNAGGRLAHLGGALFGYLYVSRASNKETNLFGWFTNLFHKKEKPLQTVHRSGKKKPTQKKHTKSDKQQQIDHILDKISKSGYDTLTKEEKEFLFRQGK